MSAPRTEFPVVVRSYEIRPDGRISTSSLLNWCQEAAFANSTALGYPPESYQELGISWVMRESEIEIIERPHFNETLTVTTWIADMHRVQAYRQYVITRADGTVLARVNTQWVTLSLTTQRPIRIPESLFAVFEPAKDYVLMPHVWEKVEGETFSSARAVAFYEEDELQHVNNANYLNWIEENARRASHAWGSATPVFQRHYIVYRLPAFKDDQVLISSQCSADGTRWHHRVTRDDTVLVEAHSLALGATA